MEQATTFANATMNKELLNEFSDKFTGILLRSGDDGYDDARKVWNGMIDKQPGLIARCKNAGDVLLAVNAAKKHNLIVSVRGGGHNVTGNAVCDGGIMIDLSLMNEVVVDPVKQIAVAQSGATWGDFDRATQQHGLASTGGLISTTGIAGLTLGGGVGWLVRKHGLSCDNLVEIEIATAKGELVKANLSENPDLFWGVRGGGGNFGVVTSMTFKVHKLGMVLGGMIIHPRQNAKEVIQFYREFVKTAPEELTLYCGLMTSPDGNPVIAFVGCYSGNPDEGEKVLKPLREFGTPVADLMQPLPYVDMQTMLNGAFPHGNRYYWKSGFMNEVSNDAIDLIISNMSTVPSPFSATILEYYGGASLREPEGGTAYPHRDAQFDLVIIASWTGPQSDDVNRNWAKNFWETMQDYTSHRVYVNTLGIEGEQRVKEAYGENYERLAALKAKYDPQNLFRLNQNIKPAGA